jgi:hypothetical protein
MGYGAADQHLDSEFRQVRNALREVSLCQGDRLRSSLPVPSQVDQQQPARRVGDWGDIPIPLWDRDSHLCYETGKEDAESKIFGPSGKSIMHHMLVGHQEERADPVPLQDAMMVNFILDVPQCCPDRNMPRAESFRTRIAH